MSLSTLRTLKDIRYCYKLPIKWRMHRYIEIGSVFPSIPFHNIYSCNHYRVDN